MVPTVAASDFGVTSSSFTFSLIRGCDSSSCDGSPSGPIEVIVCRGAKIDASLFLPHKSTHKVACWRFLKNTHDVFFEASFRNQMKHFLAVAMLTFMLSFSKFNMHIVEFYVQNLFGSCLGFFYQTCSFEGGCGAPHEQQNSFLQQEPTIRPQRHAEASQAFAHHYPLDVCRGRSM